MTDDGSAGLAGARAGSMPAIQQLLRRLGFVKLDRYGLVLTPDGRIATTRVVLDDGTGGPIVGWQDGDQAITELPAWQPPQARKAEPVNPAISADFQPGPATSAPGAVAPEPVV